MRIPVSFTNAVPTANARPADETKPSTMGRVIRASTVHANPTADAATLATLVPGEILEVLDDRNGWYLIRPPGNDTSRNWKTGWVRKDAVVLLGGDGR